MQKDIFMNKPKAIPYTDESAKNIVIRFCQEILRLRAIHYIYDQLFQNDSSRILMEKTARSFFLDLNEILHRYLLLEFAKITDPAKTHANENFTVDNIIHTIDWPKDTLKKLVLLKNQANIFRSHILDARHKLLAHTDKESFLGNRIFGKFPEGEDDIFLRTLQDICDVMHETCLGSIFGEMIPTMTGDVLSFIKTLQRAVAFDELWLVSSGTEKTRLFSYLQKAGHSKTSAHGDPLNENGV